LSFQVVRVWFCNRRQKYRREREEAAVSLPQAVLLTSNSVPTETLDSVPKPQRSMLSSRDPYPLEELCATPEFIPFQ
ncbi:hypothetical protein COOONC_09480, partial [Cooperia oncophora]